jgi:two-component system LytT family response regulator
MTTISATVLTCLIVDDEYLARCLIREYLSHHKDIQVIGECENGADAVTSILEQKPDLVFLDMQMPALNGLEVIAQTGRQHGIIFSTAFDAYAVAAFEKNAVDYLLKPYSQERFDKAITKARSQNPNTDSSITGLLIDTQSYLERLMVKDRGQTHIIYVQDITHVQAEDDYIQIHYQQKSILKTQPLSELEKQLNPADFVRIHRSILINMKFMDKLVRTQKDSYEVLLKNGVRLGVSKSGLERLRENME